MNYKENIIFNHSNFNDPTKSGLLRWNCAQGTRFSYLSAFLTVKTRRHFPTSLTSSAAPEGPDQSRNVEGFKVKKKKTNPAKIFLLLAGKRAFLLCKVHITLSKILL